MILGSNIFLFLLLWVFLLGRLSRFLSARWPKAELESCYAYKGHGSHNGHEELVVGVGLAAHRVPLVGLVLSGDTAVLRGQRALRWCHGISSNIISLTDKWPTIKIGPAKD